MINENITAEWARKTANEILGEKVKEEIKRCLSSIEMAVKNNKMQVDVYQYVEELTKKDLINRGFKINFTDNQIDGPCLTISW